QESFVTELLGDRPTIEIAGPADDAADDGFDSHGIGDQLTLTTAKDSATFERTAIGSSIDGGTGGDHPQALWGRMWDVHGLTSEGKTKFVALPLDGSPLRLDASTPGQLSFITGCNGAGGQFDLVEDRLVVVEIGPTTMMGCEPALMDQDTWIQEFLQDEPTVTIVGDHLTLATDQATIELQASDVVVGQPIGPEGPEGSDGTVSSPPQPRFGPDDPGTSGSSPSQEPAGSDAPTASTPVGDAAGIWSHTWTVVKITDGSGERRLISPADGNPLRLEATTDDPTGTTGHASFNGCNGAGGKFDLFGSRLVIAEELSHRQKLCKPDALMDQEEWLRSFLTSGPTITIAGDKLTLATNQATIELAAA
ncbi:MAG: META domain-containing protein, partial [Aquihabitans sp.]